jgi:hypothetical protein
MRCELGTVLRAPPGLRPRFDEAFVIVDERLHLQAVSRHAEALLMISEPTVVALPITDVLFPEGGPPALAGVIEEVVGGSSLGSTLKLRAADDPLRAFAVRVVPCGPPRAALLVLNEHKPPAIRLHSIVG